MSMTVPDFMPTLSRGAHGPDEGRACVMEYVSVLAGERWSDRPACTHPTIAGIARAVNDNVYEKQRHLLIPLIPRLLVANTKGVSPHPTNITIGLRDFIGDYKASWLHDGVCGAMQKYFCSLIAHCSEKWTTDAMVISILSASNGEQQIEFLTDVLDEFDRLVGRTETPEVEERQMTLAVCKVEKRVPPFKAERSGWKQAVVAKIDQIGAQFIPLAGAKPVVNFHTVWVEAEDEYATAVMEKSLVSK